MFIAQYFASGWNILPNMSVFDVVNELNKQIVPTFCLLCENLHHQVYVDFLCPDVT